MVFLLVAMQRWVKFHIANRRRIAIAKEFGTGERVVVVEFPSREAALAAYESEAYQRALDVYGDGIERDFRIVGGLD